MEPASPTFAHGAGQAGLAALTRPFGRREDGSWRWPPSGGPPTA